LLKLPKKKLHNKLKIPNPKNQLTNPAVTLKALNDPINGQGEGSTN